MVQFRELTDRYRLEKILRAGRGGTILRAADTQSGETVAIKLIPVGASPRFDQEARRFTELAGALAAAAHPSFPKVVDSGFTTDGSAFLAMEPLSGVGFETLAGDAPSRLFPLLYQALDGLQYLADRNLAHLNFAPDNLFVVTAGFGEQVKLLGLGSGLFHRPEGGGPEPDSARFRAPELIGAPEAADARADVYSFALTACQMLGATVAFGDAAGPIVQMPLALSFELENDEALRKILEGCLKQRPGDRPSPQEIRGALGLALGATRPAVGMPDDDELSQRAPSFPGLASLDLTSLDLPPLSGRAATDLPETAQSREEPYAPESLWVAPSHEPAPASLSSFDLPPLDPISYPPPAPLPTPVPSPVAAPVSPPVATGLPPLPGAATPAPPEEGAVDGDMLSSLDDLLAPLPPPVPVPVAPIGRSAGTPGRKEAAAGPGAPRSTVVPIWRNPWLMGPAAGALLLIVALAIWLLRRDNSTSAGTDTSAQPAAVAPAGPAKPPEKTPAEKLAEAEYQMGEGDFFKARQALKSLSFGDQSSLGPSSCAALRSIEETLAVIGSQRLPEDLAAGLKTGDLGLLQSAVAAGTDHEASLPANLRPDFERARNLIQLYSQAETAAAKGDDALVLERFATMESALKNLRDPSGLRDRAAAALEARAEMQGKDGKYDDAVASLDPIRKFWLNRPGFKERLKSYETFQHNEQAQAALLASIPAYERRRKPDEALALMRDLKPTPHLEAQLGEARKRLEEQLAKLDGQPPQITLRDGYYLEYSRGTVANLSFRVSDDYQVKSVRMMARPEGGKMREYSLEVARGGYYTAHFPPNYHQNGTVDFYLEATDLSNHVATFGSASQPKQLKRSQGFNRLLQ